MGLEVKWRKNQPERVKSKIRFVTKSDILNCCRDQVFVGANFTLPKEPLASTSTTEDPVTTTAGEKPRAAARLPILSEEVIAQKIKEIREKQKELRLVKNRPSILPRPKNHIPDPRTNFESLRQALFLCNICVVF